MKGIRRLVSIGRKQFRRWIDRGALLFVLFFFLSLILWLIQTFQYSYSVILKIPVEYDDIPSDIAITPPLPNHLEVEVRDNGFSLMNYRIGGSFSPIVLSPKIEASRQGQLYWNPDIIQNEVEKKIGSASRTTKILAISPSKIYADYAPKAKREVPIHLMTQIITDPGYILKRISMNPEQTIVYGNKLEIDTLKVVSTDTITIRGIKESQKIKVKLNTLKNVVLLPEYTTLNIETEKLVQVSFSIPIDVPKLKGRYQLRTFPSYIQVVCVIPVSQKELLKSSDIHVTVQTKDIEHSAQGSLNVLIDEYPEYVQVIQPDPSQVEYLLEEK